jgi:RNA polymerase sigma factor (sigma-70 family)
MATGQLDAVIGHLRTLAGSSVSELSDGQLLERFQSQRDSSAFAALVRRHGRLVWGVCRNVLHHDQDAEDAFQAAFLVLVRQAATVRKPEALASWLHGVAYRVAMRAKRAAARRRIHEKVEYPAVHASGSPVSETAWRELQAALDEEVQALPERLRVPFVLCCLEGRSQNDVAAHLGCKLSTVSSWLTRARKLLRSRLTRRGVSLPAALAAVALAQEAASATLPAPLAQATVRAARAFTSGVPLPAHLRALVKGVSPTMLLTKSKFALLVLLTAVVSAACGLAHSPAPGEEAKGAPQKPAEQQADANRQASKDKKETVTISGRVLGPDGQPFAGATVSLRNSAAIKERSRADLTTDRDGRFRTTVSRAQLEQVVVVASAEGHGPDWVELHHASPEDHELTLRLCRDDVPITGRILNLEGRGIAGVKIDVRRIEKRQDDGDLAEFIATKQKWARGNFVNGPAMKTLAAEALPMRASAATDADGRFRLTGFGRERVVHLTLHAGGIATTYVEVLTRAGPVEGTTTGNENEATYGATFERLSAPSKPIAGTVREKGTGQPLAGVVIYSGRCEARSDAKGEYRIDGVRKKPSYMVAAHGTSFFSVTKTDVEDTLGFEPVRVDFELERGLAIRVRVVDKATRKPVAAGVTYHAFMDNPHLKSVAGFGPGGLSERDGSYNVTGLPGPGLLWVLAHEDDYVKVERNADWVLVPAINTAPPVAHAYVRIDPSENDPKSATFEIALEPAKTVKASVMDMDGKPLRGYFVAGQTASPRQTSSWLMPKESPTFSMRGLDGRRSRMVVVFSAEKKLGKAQVVRGDEAGTVPIRLEPLSSVTGRVLDAGGRPLAGVHVRATLEGKGDYGACLPVQFFITSATWAEKLEPKGTTDADGKFRLNGLLPGLKYTLLVSEDGSADPERLIVQRAGLAPPPSGHNQDLGDLRRQKSR